MADRDPRGQEGVRMFVSLDPPPEARREAAEWGRLAARSHRGLRPVDPAAVHLTLAFLGSLPADRTGPLAEVIERSAGPAGTIESGAPIWLPRRRPRALALELREETGALDALRAELVGEIGRLTGWEPERPGFLPHLTVARAGRGFRPAGIELAPTPSLRFEPASITLYRSHLDPEGARYEALHTAPLGHPSE